MPTSDHSPNQSDPIGFRPSHSIRQDQISPMSETKPFISPPPEAEAPDPMSGGALK